MVPLWLVYLLIALIILADAVLFAGIVVVGLFLIAYVGLNVFTGFIKLMINQLIKDILEYLKRYIESKSKGKTAGYARGLVDVVKWVYTVVFWAYNVFQLALDVVVALAAVGLILIGMAALAVLNAVLAWLVYAFLI
jgi:hypothetical protein